MWDSVYYNDPRAPWNEKDLPTRKCDECDGEGYEYWVADVETEYEQRVREAVYDECPSTRAKARKLHKPYYQFEACKCEKCQGDGFIVLEEMDYEDEDRYEDYLLRKAGY